MTEFLMLLRTGLGRIQSKLEFEDWSEYPQFSSTKSLGRAALISCCLSVIGTAHLVVGILLWYNGWSSSWSSSSSWLWIVPKDDDEDGRKEDKDRRVLLGQWCAYMTLLCLFHLLEFFVTAVWNPTAASSDSFLVNHSTTYTAAFLTSSTEFWMRYIWFPGSARNWWWWWSASAAVPATEQNSVLYSFLLRWLLFPISSFSRVGLVLVVISQVIRSWAMITAGESFNHIIQTRKKENHVLVTHGIYSIFRHPSYMGFFYWSVGTQILLGNILHAVLFTVSSWSFFNRRIPYEEESLCQHFPEEYPLYVARTYMGIPWIRSTITTSAVEANKKD